MLNHTHTLTHTCTHVQTSQAEQNSLPPYLSILNYFIHPPHHLPLPQLTLKLLNLESEKGEEIGPPRSRLFQLHVVLI